MSNENKPFSEQDVPTMLNREQGSMNHFLRFILRKNRKAR